jgi:ATP-binding protein involved in chromosome partitioning
VNPFEKQKPIEGVKTIIAISSGKGGVGKSTISANLSVAFVKLGYKVGLLDADIYGPSQPRLFGAINQRPAINSANKIIPLFRYGVKIMSMGFLVEENAAIVWRGPMLFKAMNQLVDDVDWGELDLLLVDLPPGTGDVQLSLVQKVPLRGAIAISTPQNVALADVKKSIDMFQKVQIPILGVVENMSYFLNPANGEKLEMFPRGQIDTYIQMQNLTKIGEIPFDPRLSQSAELGIPVIESNPNGPTAEAFSKIAARIAEKLNSEIKL